MYINLKLQASVGNRQKKLSYPLVRNHAKFSACFTGNKYFNYHHHIRQTKEQFQHTNGEKRSKTIHE